MENMDVLSRQIEHIRVILFVGSENMEHALTDYSPIFDEMAQHGIHEISVLAQTGDAAAVESALADPKNTLCIAIGYSFRNREIAELFTRAVESGLRLLVLDADLEYKMLAERLKITNIKHKVRIEKMKFDHWDADKLRLLSVILSDELQRLLRSGS